MRFTIWLACALAVVAQAQPVEKILHNFASPPKGAGLWAGVVRDKDGNIYGTSIDGGSDNLGVVFKVDAKGHASVLHSFTAGSDGAHPYGLLVSDAAGNLYGTTYQGGTGKAGTVYKVDATGRETVLYAFNGGTDGKSPVAGVVLDGAGNLYGVTRFGGAANRGVVFKLDTAGHETVLYSFESGSDGSGPYASLTLDGEGNLYGTTREGGTAGGGTVFKLDPGGHETVLYNFSGAGGIELQSSVVLGKGGNLYGTTSNGGLGYGVVFKLDAAGQETVLYSFTGGADGAIPYSGLVRDPAGNFYGTAYAGGSAGAGVVYKVDLSGHQTVLYSFTGFADGNGPEGGVVLDSAGNLYGTTSGGGAANEGAVYELDGAGHESVIYSFPGAKDGEYPNYATLLRDSAGNLYGTTNIGGIPGRGIVYKVDATNKETVLYTFSGGVDGAYPWAGVVMDSAGNLYGTTNSGGTAGAGVAYKLDSSGNQTVLHSFAGGTDGANPRSGVVLDASGNLYGTTYAGGAANSGVVYKLDAAGNETILYSFTGGSDGAYPWAGVILDSSGNLYGTTFQGGSINYGVVYKIDTAGHQSVLYAFMGGADGASPSGGLVLDSAGNLYGTTQGSSSGVVFKLDTAGHESVLHTFGHNGDGRIPFAGVTLDAAGNIYGTAYEGGPGGHGIVFELDSSGKETILAAFTGHDKGSYPYAGVVVDAAGNVYGTTGEGGTKGTGVIFEIEP